MRGFRLIYPYQCPSCGHGFEVIKSVRAIDEPEHCEKCQTQAERRIARTQSFSGASDWDTAHYSPAFGRVVRSNKEARMLAKERGLIEVGNEDPHKIDKKFDTERQKKSEERWTETVRSLTSLGEINS